MSLFSNDVLILLYKYCGLLITEYLRVAFSHTDIDWCHCWRKSDLPTEYSVGVSLLCMYFINVL